MKVRAAVACVALFLGFPVCAQSSLGISGATLDLGSTEDESGTRRSRVASSVDVRITGAHGLQGDLSFAETSSGTVGQLAAHLYMAPRPGQKYGLFVSLSDVDGRALSWLSLGAEGMLSLGQNTTLEGRVGLGATDGGSRDFIFGGVSLAHALSPALELEAALDVADFDETSFRATSIDASLTARYSPEGSPWGAYASVTRSDLTGRDDASAATRIGFGVTLNFGASGGVDPHTRPFRSTDPGSPLVRRGIW